MKKILFSTICASLLLTAQYGSAHAFAKGEQDCTKCHSINADKATSVLKELLPDVKVLEINPGPLAGIWEVAVDSGGRKAVVYIDYSLKKVIAGNVFDTTRKINLTKESFDRINKVDLSLIPYDKALLMGSRDAKYKVAVFDDPD